MQDETDRFCCATLGGRSPRYAEQGRQSVIYVGTDDRTLSGLDARDGSQIWRRTLGASPSFPIVTQQAVYTTTMDGTLSAWLPRDGTPLWTQRLGTPFPSPPAATGGYVFVGTSAGDLHAFDAETGLLVWQRTVSNLLTAQPVAADGRVFVCTDTGQVHAFAVSDGAPLWPVPLFIGGMVTLTATPFALVARSANGPLVAVRIDDAVTLWRVPSGYAGLANLSIADDLVYITVHRLSGRTRTSMQALRLKDGGVAWETHADMGLLSVSAVVDGRVYSSAGMADELAVYAFDARDGRELWQWRTAAVKSGITTPVATPEAVYVSAGTVGVCALQATDGWLLWQSLQGTMVTGPAVS